MFKKLLSALLGLSFIFIFSLSVAAFDKEITETDVKVVVVNQENDNTTIFLSSGNKYTLAGTYQFDINKNYDIVISGDQIKSINYHTDSSITSSSASEEVTPAYIWAVIMLGMILIISVIILIVRTRRIP